MHACTGQTVGITWNNMTVANNSLVTLAVVLQRVNTTNTMPGLYPLVCQGIAGGQWYDPNGVLYQTESAASTPEGSQLNISQGVELFRGVARYFPHGVQCCTNTTTTLCVGMYTDPIFAAINLATGNPISFALSVAATCKYK